MTTTMEFRLLKTILGREDETKFILEKFALLEELNKKYSKSTFDNEMIDIVDNVQDVLSCDVIVETYKHLGELIITSALMDYDWYSYDALEIDDIIDCYCRVNLNGTNTTYDSILSEFDFKNITKDDIRKFNLAIQKDFKVDTERAILIEKTVLDYEDESPELATLQYRAQEYINKLLEGSGYKAEIWETDDLYEDYEDNPESDYNGRAMYEGKLVTDDENEEELEESLTGRYCEIFAIFEELLSFIESDEFKEIKTGKKNSSIDGELDSWLEDSCCPKCKGFDYEEDDIEHSASNEHFRRWSCPCGAVWQERYNLTKVFYGSKEVEVTSEEFDNLAFENKKMAYFIEKLGLSIDDITDNIISGDNDQLNEAIKKATQTPCFLVNRHIAQSVLVLFNNELGHSDSKFIHDCDNQKILVELGGDLEDEEFEDSYKKLFKLIKKPNRNNFYICY